MNITIEQVEYGKKSILRHLIELYNYDFSEFTNEDVNDIGLYEYKYLDNYWNEPSRFPFFIKVNGRYAGFALLRRITNSTGTYHSMAEFFVMKKYRKIGVGNTATKELFNKFKGDWEISVLKENSPAQAYWKKVICEFTKENYKMIENEKGDVLFTFNNLP